MQSPPIPRVTPPTNARAAWYAIGQMRDEFAAHRLEDREDFKAIRDELSDMKSAVSGFDGKLDQILAERDHLRQQTTVAIVQTEETKRVKLTTSGKVIAALIGLITGAISLIAAGAHL